MTRWIAMQVHVGITQDLYILWLFLTRYVLWQIERNITLPENIRQAMLYLADRHGETFSVVVMRPEDRESIVSYFLLWIKVEFRYVGDARMHFSWRGRGTEVTGRRAPYVTSSGKTFEQPSQSESSATAPDTSSDQQTPSILACKPM